MHGEVVIFLGGFGIFIPQKELLIEMQFLQYQNGIKVRKLAVTNFNLIKVIDYIELPEDINNLQIQDSVDYFEKLKEKVINIVNQ